MYKRILRPFLFLLNPETAHILSLKSLGLVGKLPFGRSILKLFFKKKPKNLERELFGIKFPHPVGLAAGLDKNGDYYNDLAALGFSFIEIGSLTPNPQEGNPRPRLFRLVKDRAIINRMGINNKGIRYAIDRIRKEKPNVIIAASIAKNTTSKLEEDIIHDYMECFSLMYDFVDMFTINVSCPNVVGLQGLQDLSFLSDLLDPLLDLRRCYETYKPILVKLSPDINEIQLNEILDWCMLYGIDGIVATNTTRSRDNLKVSKSRIEAIGNGGLSGAPLYEKSLAMVRKINEHTKGRLPVIGVGGIMTPAQAKEMLDAGASLVEVYTGFIYNGPAFVGKIIKYLSDAKR
ncbi:MAG: quinone-dependent dihydroorotate dehydrogenase [Bacteroidales bacterium]|nr:quinone-dependent dihydroorotate dehydrogenase [Bacteroidales bacterium]